MKHVSTDQDKDKNQEVTVVIYRGKLIMSILKPLKFLSKTTKERMSWFVRQRRRVA